MHQDIEPTPYEKSIRFLRDVCAIDGIELIESESTSTITVRVRGRSRRHYEIVASRQVGLLVEEPWTTEVTGAAWKSDLVSEQTRAYTAKLCLNIHHDKEHLPLGDQLAALALSLHNDIKLAMDIALVAQFIVCPRDELLNVHIFQDEMVVTEDMIENGGPSIDVNLNQEFEYVDFFEDFWPVHEPEHLELQLSGNSWARDVENDIMQRYDRRNN
ncbi:MAG: hypothetical protein ACPH9F_05965 [Candidatus Poseidoniaceae archaeon]